ncbi:hypothetical protein E5358_11075 [Palleniella muris]|uniref:Uncharacterized protein n=1 Tax=Palleniella muris TaxID=3038145 RepID=A0AC61QNK6_9BACT|nr:hypothetical protein [Palleniella muris]TGX81155.1 hypothetical protein E5358_11075 [Palleniella muris]
MKKILSIIAALVCVLTVSAQSVNQSDNSQKAKTTSCVGKQCTQSDKCTAKCGTAKCEKQCDKSAGCKSKCEKKCGNPSECKKQCDKQCTKSEDCKKQCIRNNAK